MTSIFRILAALPLLCAATCAWPADRPCIVANSAAAEDDQEQVMAAR